MSYSSAAHLYWGFDVTFPRNNSAEVHADDTSGVTLVTYGDLSNSSTAVCIASSLVKVDTDSWAVPVSAMSALPAWAETLRVFCDKHGLPWPTDGYGWHLAASRL